MDTFTTRRLDCGHYFHEDVRREAEGAGEGCGAAEGVVVICNGSCEVEL